MLKFISIRFAALAAAFVLVYLLGISRNAIAQPPPPPCASCLQAVCDRNPSLCNCDSTDTACYTWALLNTCDSCIESIIVSTKNGAPFSSCCAVIENPTRSGWAANQVSPNMVDFYDTSGNCLAAGQSLQVTTCGITPGIQIQLQWSPADSGCVNYGQGELTLAPPKGCK